MSSRGKLIVGGVLTYVGAVGAGLLYSNTSDAKAQKIEHVDVHLDDHERLHTYAKLAPKYDSDIGMDEFFMGINLLRRFHMKKAKGDVLEVGCGPGRNFSYYDGGKVKSILAVDAVPEMVQMAEKKLKSYSKLKYFLPPQVMDTHTLDYPTGSYDTVVDTFGLCSYDDPVEALREMTRVCKPDGRILLIEHGKGTSEWINNLLNSNAENHAHNWGCIYNRDIESIVRSSGLEIVDMSRWHFGTTYVIEAKPKSSSS